MRDGYFNDLCFDCWEADHPNQPIPDDADPRTCAKHLLMWARDEADMKNDDAWMGR